MSIPALHSYNFGFLQERKRKRTDATLPSNRLLSDVKIDSMATLEQAIQALHTRYHIPHIVITSVSLPASPNSTPSSSKQLSVIGSTMTSTGQARAFRITFPAIDAYFSGTGDMFAALMVVRMREAVYNAPAPKTGTQLRDVVSWVSPDDVDALDLPLARAAEKVLASMHEVLTRTAEGMSQDVRNGNGVEKGGDAETRAHLLKTRGAELRLVRSLASLRAPTVEFKATRIE